MDIVSIDSSFLADTNSGLTLAGESSATQSVLANVPSCSSSDRGSVQDTSNMWTSKQQPSVLDFAEQIRHLEIEGNKLRSSTVKALSQLGPSSLNLSDSSTSSPEIKSADYTLSPSLSSLVDISAEQKTISDLRIQLESHRRETERLQSHLLGDVSSARTYSGLSFSSPAKTAFSTVPATELSALSTSRRAFELVPPSHMERALKESQEQVIELRKRLQEASEMSEQQKRSFRANIEELKGKLHETIVNRDTVLDLRQKEVANQEMMLVKLQSSLSQLQEKCLAQEQALQEMHKQTESTSQSNSVMAVAMSQLRTVLAARERARGKPYLEGDPVGSNQNASTVVLTLERCLQEADRELDTRLYKLSLVEKELEETRLLFAEKEEKQVKEYQERLKAEAQDAVKKLSHLTTDHEKQLEEANEHANNARKQASSLQAQLQMLQDQQQQQGRLKNETIGELETKLQHLKQDYADDRKTWHERRQALEMSLDEVQRELIQVRAERSEIFLSQATMETKVEDLQMQISRLEGDLETERDRSKQQREREEDLRLKISGLEGELIHRQQEVDRLERMLEVVKQEASLAMHERVASTERQERERYQDQISTLSNQLSANSDKYSKLNVEYERARMEIEAQRQKIGDLKVNLQANQSQYETVRVEKHHIAQQVEEQRIEIECLRQDRDHYRKLAEDKEDEVMQLRLTVERATLQLEEKEKVLCTVQQQSSSITHLMEFNSRTSDNMREEREHLMKVVEEKTAALEELRSIQEAMSKKMKLREKRIKDLEDDRAKIMEELSVKHQESSLLQQEKENIFAELKESRLEVARLTENKDNLKRDLSKLKSAHAKEVNKLHAQLKEAEHNCKLTHRALKTKDLVDQKAVKVADKVQKEITAKRSEVDNLRSKLRRLEEKLESVNKEKMLIEHDKDSLKASLGQSLRHTTHLTEELEASQAHNATLTRQIRQLEDKLEKESLKCAASQAQLEHFEQEIATLKLRHQLDLKETEQMSQVRVPGISWVMPKESTTVNVGHRASEPSPSVKRKNSAASVASLGDKKSLIPQPQPESYSEAGQELKALLEEMRKVIAEQRETNHKPHDRPTRSKLRSRSMSPDKNKNTYQSHLSKHEQDRSLTLSCQPCTEKSSISAGTGINSNPPSPFRKHNLPSKTDLTRDRSFHSEGSPSDVTELTSSLSSSPLEHSNEPLLVIPDTQELCRRLEEKIANLTRMGSNLQQENQEMAQLITEQGKKLDVVRKNERKLSEYRR